ncbi:MAG TPA: LPXTG cell wall anchor domain-containing protein [Acidimicrobiales bacterium]|nr:LPXTG cell wall anchor domain-containing protein [Acidimicrobiales bacterium]
MLRKIVFVLVALALPLVAASAASAEQYPPTGDGPAPSTAVVDEGSEGGGAPLPDTGTDVTLLAGVAFVLVAGGAVAVVASRRRGAALRA